MRIGCIQTKTRNWEEADKAWVDVKEIIRVSGDENDILILPECVFPAYFLSPTEKPEEAAPVQSILDELSEICREKNVYIAFGYAENNRNVASLFDKNGNEIVKKYKSNLWHFDRLWFEQGEDVAIADTEFGRIGIIICADARMPELVRSTALQGAKLIIDLANLTASGAYIDKLNNAQCEYMLSTRARENCVWLAMSDKWGVEADCVTYAGKSSIYGPDGSCKAQAPSNENSIISYEIPTDAYGQIICEPGLEDMPKRRPELYHILCRENPDIPAYKDLVDAVIPELMSPYLTITSFCSGEFGQQEQLKQISRLINHQPDIIVIPTYGALTDKIEDYQRLLNKNQFLVIGDKLEGKTRSRLITSEAVISTYITTHSTKDLPDDSYPNDFPVVLKTPFGKIGFIHEYEMLLPEAVRSTMLCGADMIIWQHGMPLEKALPLARTRASENRIYIAAVYSKSLNYNNISEPAASFIVEPSGNIAASTLSGLPVHSTGTYCHLCNSHIKVVVPGTHILFDRVPNRYKGLIASDTAEI